MARATSQRFHAAACSPINARILVASASVNCRDGAGSDGMTGDGGTGSATAGGLPLLIIVLAGVASNPRRTCPPINARILVASASVNCRDGAGSDGMTGDGGTGLATAGGLPLLIIVLAGVASNPRRTCSIAANIAGDT